MQDADFHKFYADLKHSSSAADKLDAPDIEEDSDYDDATDIDNILCREQTKSNAPSLSAVIFADYFDTKIGNIRSATERRSTTDVY